MSLPPDSRSRRIPPPSCLIEGLRTLYTSEGEWAVFTEVRSSPGSVEDLRIADAIGVCLWPSSCRELGTDGWRLLFFEAKETRSDWLRERARPEKSALFRKYCSGAYLVVRDPWKNVVTTRDELLPGWGLIAVGTGAPHVVVQAAERPAELPPGPFVRAMFRAAAREIVRLTPAPVSRVHRRDR